MTTPDITPPVVTQLQAVPTDISATISWLTNEPATSQVEWSTTPPPALPAIIGVQWEPTLVKAALGSDGWPITWADDGDLYTAYGNGQGFDSLGPRLSLGFAKVQGFPPNLVGVNIRSASGERDMKSYGMLMVDGILYMWAINTNAGSSVLAWSLDHAVNWTWAPWIFSEFGIPCFLNFGQNYQGARDNFIYTFSPDIPSAFNETNTAILMRALRGLITDRTAYEFFAGRDVVGNPIWSRDVLQRLPVLIFPGGVNRMDVSYIAPFGRYVMTMRSVARAGGQNQFSLWEAPEPWGPWTQFFLVGGRAWDVDPGESSHIPTKWVGADGSFYLVFSGTDAFMVRRGVFLR